MKIVSVTFDGFEGSVEFDVPSFKERLQEISSLGFMEKNGEVNVNKELDQTLMIIDMAKKRIKTVNLLHVESNSLITDLEEISHSAEYGEIMTKLANIYSTGVRLGKN